MKTELTPYKITYLLLIVCFLTGFTQRFSDIGNKLTLIIFSGAAFATFHFQRRYKVLKGEKKFINTLILIIFLLFLFAIIYGIIPNFLFSLFCISVFIIPLTLIPGLEYWEKIRLVRLILLVAVLQIFVDIIYPNTQYSDLDKYCGFFNSGNNKARFLVFPIIILIGLLINKEMRTTIFRVTRLQVILFALPILISFYLGHSGMSFLFLMLAVGFALIIKRLKYFILANAIGIVSIYVYLSRIIGGLTNYDALWWIYYRFLDADNGILAAYIYGFDLFKESHYLGVGLGNFATRASIFFETKNAYGYPAVNIVDVKADFNKYNAINYPDWGMNPFYLYFIEIGLLVLPLIYFLFKKLWGYKANNFVGYCLFFFIFYVINYWPQFFDEFYSYLYLSIFMIINDVFKYKQSQPNFR